MSRLSHKKLPDGRNKVSLAGSVLFTVCSILVLDSLAAPAMIGVSAISLWIFSAVFFFVPYGLVSAELGSSFPEDGGIAGWVGRAFGEFPGVLVGWMYWLSVVFWMPSVCTAFTGWLSIAVLPGVPHWALGIVSVCICWGIVLLTIRGVDLSVTVADAMAVIKMTLLLILGLLGVAYAIRFGPANDFSLRSWIPGRENAVSYVGAIVFDLLGFELIGSLGSRIREPKRTIPLMTVISGVLISVLYAFGTFGILAALRAVEVNAVSGFVDALRELCRVFGSAGEGVFHVLIILASSTLLANMITWTVGATETFQRSGLGERSRFLAHRSRRYGTSDHLGILIGIVSTAMIVLNHLLSGDANEIFWSIFSFSSIILMLNYLFLFPAAIRLKYADCTPRAYEVPGGKTGMWIASCLGFLFTFLSCILLIDRDVYGNTFRMQAIGVTVTILTGYMLFLSGRRNTRRNDPRHLPEKQTFDK